MLLGLLVAALSLVAAGCGSDEGSGGGGGDVEALPSSSCTAIEYEGDGDPDYIVASDFPLQGSSRTQTEQIVAAIKYELGNRNWKAGDYNIGFQSCDDATAQAGITCVIQPGGSIRDSEVIKAADEHGMAMILTGMRHFRH